MSPSANPWIPTQTTNPEPITSNHDTLSASFHRAEWARSWWDPACVCLWTTPTWANSTTPYWTMVRHTTRGSWSELVKPWLLNCVGVLLWTLLFDPRSDSIHPIPIMIMIIPIRSCSSYCLSIRSFNHLSVNWSCQYLISLVGASQHVSRLGCFWSVVREGYC